MNASELALKMLEYQAKMEELQKLEEEIAGAVMILGKTQVVGSVRATYSSGRKTFKYQEAVDAAVAAAAAIGQELPNLTPYQTDIPATVKTDWRAACTGLGLTPGYTRGTPKVTIKIEGGQK